MVKVVNGNITKCHNCCSYLEFNKEDIETKEMSYGVQTYAGETYIGKLVTCPKCGNKIEVY